MNFYAVPSFFGWFIDLHAALHCVSGSSGSLLSRNWHQKCQT